jgi:hypothetical protein
MQVYHVAIPPDNQWVFNGGCGIIGKKGFGVVFH